MSSQKGPEFFVSMFKAGRGNGPGDDRKPIVKNLHEYRSLFADVGNEKVIGEGSVSYLYHHNEAIPLIREYLGDPRILITLRDPVAHAFSCYLHLKRHGRETFSFEDGLAAEHERMEKGWHYQWHYLHSGFYTDQVAAYLKNFSRVKICFLEDMQRDIKTFVKDIFRFLEVDETFEPHVSTQYNVGGVPRSKLLYRLVVGDNPYRSGPKALQLAGRLVGHLLGEERFLRWREAALTALLVREPLKARTRTHLMQVYRPDVLRLQDLLGRDLSGWLVTEEE